MSDFFTSALVRPKTLPSHISCAASRVQPPANTESCCNNIRSGIVNSSQLQSMEAWRVSCLANTPRLSIASKTKESFNCFKISLACKILTRTAASSMANGMPSILRQIFTTVWAFSFVNWNDEWANFARSVNNRIDSFSINFSVNNSLSSGTERDGR